MMKNFLKSTVNALVIFSLLITSVPTLAMNEEDGDEKKYISHGRKTRLKKMKASQPHPSCLGEITVFKLQPKETPKKDILHPLGPMLSSKALQRILTPLEEKTPKSKVQTKKAPPRKTPVKKPPAKKQTSPRFKSMPELTKEQNWAIKAGKSPLSAQAAEMEYINQIFLSNDPLGTTTPRNGKFQVSAISF